MVRTSLPFLPTPMGKGVIPDDHPLCVAPARSRLINIPLILYSTLGNFVFLQFFPFGPHSPWSSKNLWDNNLVCH